jgi:hypothetical protein
MWNGSHMYRRSGDEGLVVHDVRPTSAIALPSSQNALASEPTIKSAKDTHSKANPQRATNAAIISLSVISSLAMVIILTWYLRLRRQEQLARLRLGSDRSSSRHTRSGGGSGSGTRYVEPLKTSFVPSLRSSFGFTGASPNSPWSRTEVGRMFMSRCHELMVGDYHASHQSCWAGVPVFAKG